MIKDARDSSVGSENYCYSPGDLGELVNLSILNCFNQKNWKGYTRVNPEILKEERLN